MPGRVNLLTILLLSTVALNSCGDRRPVWSVSETAVTALALDSTTPIGEGRGEDSTARPCRAVLSLRPSGDFPPAALLPDEMRSVLTQAKHIRFECIGSCGETETCKIHHMVDSPHPEWATTGCVCDPQSPPPCRLTVRWASGESARRRIDQINCGAAAEAGSCSLLSFHRGKDLQIGCESPN